MVANSGCVLLSELDRPPWPDAHLGRMQGLTPLLERGFSRKARARHCEPTGEESLTEVGSQAVFGASERSQEIPPPLRSVGMTGRVDDPIDNIRRASTSCRTRFKRPANLMWTRVVLNLEYLWGYDAPNIENST